MGNTIKKETVFIETMVLTNSSAFREGEYVGNYKQDGRWIAKDSNGKKWQNLTSNLRNENFYKFINQYSMPELVQYLRDKVADYYTVAYEFLVTAIETTFEETRMCCIDDIYKYVSKNLI